MYTKPIKSHTINLLRLTMALFLLIGMFGFQPVNAVYAADTIIYVRAGALGTNTGTSWANAYTNLQSALSPAPPTGTQIWVAAGTYKPGTLQADTFQLVNGVSIYGGFDGTEGTLEERDPKANVTILSGEIGSPSNNEDNIFHVVTGSGTGNTAVLDGFTVTAGNAYGDSSGAWGGGIINESGSPTISNTIFIENSAEYGGGMFNHPNSSPIVTNVTFSGNSADRGAGMYNNDNSNPTLTKVTFVDNTASVRGGGLTISTSSPTLTNVTFSGNQASLGSAIHILFSSNPILKNVTISGNISTNADGGAIYNQFASSPVITNTILYNNAQGEIINSIDSVPVVSYSIVEGGYTGTGNLNVDPLLGSLADNGGYTQTMALNPISPAIDAGNDANCAADDQRGFTRPQGAHCDIGAYEVDNTAPNTTLVSFPPNPDSDNTPSFTFSGNDFGGSGIASFLCRMDGGSYSPCTSPYTSSPLAAGSHTFDVYAIDNVSNADPTPASHTWSLEFTPTLVSSIVRDDASPTSAASVDFVVTFSANVTGVDSGDFALALSGVSGASVTGVSGSNNVYTVSVNTGAGDGTIRLDIPASADIDDPNGNAPTNLPYTGDQSYKIIKIGTFQDVTNAHWAWRWIEAFYNQGITTGCLTNPLRYCPEREVTRAEMAVFILRAKYGAGHQPDPAQTDVFADVPVADKEWMQPWIEEFYEEGITTGCLPNPLRYCPERQVTRAEMAVFILRAKYGAAYQPDPAQTGIFADVPVTGKEWMQPWIEEFYEQGITTGCAAAPLRYCPEQLVTRAEMAVFIDRAFGIPPLP